MADAKYYTFKRNVPLKPGQVVGWAPGHGYYAKTLKAAKVTSAAPPAKTSSSKVAAKAKVAAAKARHTVAPTLAAKRKLVVAFCTWAIANTEQIHYAETRPIPQIKAGKLPVLPFTTDCSGFATMAYQYAGLADPNRASYNGQGFTGTLLGGTKVAKQAAADIGVFGPPTGHHAVVALEAGTDPDLASHGSEAGPLKIKRSVEQDYQPSPLTWIEAVPA